MELLLFDEMALWSNKCLSCFQVDKKAAEHAAEILKAIAHPVRPQIVKLLETKEMCVGDIVEALEGILDCRRDGTKLMGKKVVHDEEEILRDLLE